MDIIEDCKVVGALDRINRMRMDMPTETRHRIEAEGLDILSSDGRSGGWQHTVNFRHAYGSVHIFKISKRCGDVEIVFSKSIKDKIQQEAMKSVILKLYNDIKIRHDNFIEAKNARVEEMNKDFDAFLKENVDDKRFV